MDGMDIVNLHTLGLLPFVLQVNLNRFCTMNILLTNANLVLNQSQGIDFLFGPTQVKRRLLISSIFDAMNFKHFLEMFEFDL